MPLGACHPSGPSTSRGLVLVRASRQNALTRCSHRHNLNSMAQGSAAWQGLKASQRAGRSHAPIVAGAVQRGRMRVCPAQPPSGEQAPICCRAWQARIKRPQCPPQLGAIRLPESARPQSPRPTSKHARTAAGRLVCGRSSQWERGTTRSIQLFWPRVEALRGSNGIISTAQPLLHPPCTNSSSATRVVDAVGEGVLDLEGAFVVDVKKKVGRHCEVPTASSPPPSRCCTPHARIQALQRALWMRWGRTCLTLKAPSS
jgi:hypothetical protein